MSIRVLYKSSSTNTYKFFTIFFLFFQKLALLCNVTLLPKSEELHDLLILLHVSHSWTVDLSLTPFSFPTSTTSKQTSSTTLKNCVDRQSGQVTCDASHVSRQCWWNTWRQYGMSRTSSLTSNSVKQIGQSSIRCFAAPP